MLSLKMKGFFVILFAFSFLYGEEEITPFTNPDSVDTRMTTFTEEPVEQERWFLEFKLGYFYFQDKRARKIYDNGGFIFRTEADYHFFDSLLLWLEGSYFAKNGPSLGFERLSTKFETGTITLGLKGIYSGKYCAFYGGAGPRLFFLSVRNRSQYVKYRQHFVGIGGGITTGLLIFPWDRSLGYFDIFLDYALKSCHFSSDGKSSFVRHKVAIGGLSAGLGLGLRF